jgi:hypothetical protein
MAPVGLAYRSSKGWMIIHECQACGHRRANRAALDDPRQADDAVALARLGQQQ